MIELKDLPQPLDSTYLPARLLKVAEGKDVTWTEFLSDHVSSTSAPVPGNCEICSGILNSLKTVSSVASYLGRGKEHREDFCVMTTSLCLHQFHAGCLLAECKEGSGISDCPICGTNWYTSTKDRLDGQRVLRDLGRFSMIDAASLVDYLLAARLHGRVLVNVDDLVYCFPLAAYALQTGRLRNPWVGGMIGIAWRENGRFVVETIVHLVKELTAAEDPAYIEASEENLAITESTLYGQGNKEIRLVGTILGGSLTPLWKMLVNQVIGAENLGPKHGCFYFAAQVIGLGIEFYLREYEMAKSVQNA